MSKPTKHYGKWRIRWVDEHGERQSAVLDEFKTALLVLRQNELEADERRRGLRDPAPTERTVDDIAEYWERERSPLKKSADDDKSILKQLRAAFGKTKLADFAGLIMAVDRYQATKAHLNVKTIANHLTLLGSLLGLAHDLGWMPRVPKIKKPKVRLISQDFSYLRTTEEIRRFLVAAEAEGEQTHVLYATALYTGGREGEIAALEWADVDFENRLITIQRSFDGPTKADDLRYVPILDVLLPVLRAWRLRAPGRLLFTNRDGRMFQPSSRVFPEPLLGRRRPCDVLPDDGHVGDVELARKPLDELDVVPPALAVLEGRRDVVLSDQRSNEVSCGCFDDFILRSCSSSTADCCAAVRAGLRNWRFAGNDVECGEVMTEQLKNVVELARARTMASDEREDQLRNFAAGNVGLENERVTRAVVDEAAKRIGQNTR